MSEPFFCCHWVLRWYSNTLFSWKSKKRSKKTLPGLETCLTCLKPFFDVVGVPVAIAVSEGVVVVVVVVDTSR